MIRFKDIIAEHGGDPTCFLSFDEDSDQVHLLPYATLSAARTTESAAPLSALIGVYEWQNAPLFMLVDGDALSGDPEGLTRLRRLVAMRGDAPYLAVLQMGRPRASLSDWRIFARYDRASLSACAACMMLQSRPRIRH